MDRIIDCKKKSHNPDSAVLYIFLAYDPYGDVWFLKGTPPNSRESRDDARGHQMAERQRCGGPRGKQERLVAPSKVKIRH